MGRINSIKFRDKLFKRSWGQHGTHLGPVGPSWVSCWPHELCYQGWHGIGMLKIANNISRSLGIMNKIKRCLPTHILRSLYDSLILLHLQHAVLSWASYQIRKIVGCACAGNAGNVFPATADKRSQYASRHVRDAHAVMHAGIAN